MTVTDAKDYLDIVYHLVYLVGIPVAVVLFFINENRKRIQERMRLYIELNNRYLDFLKLILQFQDCGVSEYDLGRKPLRLPKQRMLRQKILFSFLTSNMERAFLLNQSRRGVKDDEEWKTWHAWISEYLENPNYRAYWEQPGRPGVFLEMSTFNPSFVEYMAEQYKKQVTAISKAAKHKRR